MNTSFAPWRKRLCKRRLGKSDGSQGGFCEASERPYFSSRGEKKDCAAAVGITTGGLSQFFSKTAVPSFDTLISLANYLDVSIDYLVGRNDDPHTSSKSKEEVLLLQLPDELLPAYQAAKETNPEKLQEVIETFAKMAGDYHSLTNSLSK